MSELIEAKAQLQQEALGRLMRIARCDTGQSAKVASFLLAWWNADTCGGWDVTDLWAVDREIADDMLTVLRMIRELGCYPDRLGAAAQRDFHYLIEQWRPRLLDEQAAG